MYEVAQKVDVCFTWINSRTVSETVSLNHCSEGGHVECYVEMFNMTALHCMMTANRSRDCLIAGHCSIYANTYAPLFMHQLVLYIQNMAALSSSDAEFMLAMSRTYGSLPMMGCWPAQPPTSSTETPLKMLETSHQTLTGAAGLPYQPAASSVSHISDPYMQALIAR